jgi:hypothetical protein
MWDAWGGSSGINWAINKLKQIDKWKKHQVAIAQRIVKELVYVKTIPIALSAVMVVYRLKELVV